MKLKIFLLICYHNIFFVLHSQQCYMATLKEGIDSLSIVTLEMDTATIYAGEKFIIYRDHWTNETVEVWTNKGENDYKVDSSYIKILPSEVVFKMAPNRKLLFRMSCSEKSIKMFEKYHVDICELVKSAEKGDKLALKRYFALAVLIENNDRRANLVLVHISWNLLHIYGDKEFSLFLKNMNKDFRNKIAWYITLPTVTFPISDYKIFYRTTPPIPLPVTNTRTYFKTNFPKTWRIIRKKRYTYKNFTFTYD